MVGGATLTKLIGTSAVDRYTKSWYIASTISSIWCGLTFATSYLNLSS
jgi:hypothetical protein